LLSRGLPYRRLFADEHFLEIAQAAAGLKAAAFERANMGEPTTPSDPRILMTRCGLAVVYTLRRTEEDFIHHFSVSVAGSITAHAVGATFVTFVSQIIGLPLATMRFEIAPSTVHQGEATLGQDEHERLAGSPTPAISTISVAEFRRACQEARRALVWN